MLYWLTLKKWMVIVFVLGFVHASSYALLVPPWQAPDEPGHFEYGCLLEPLGRPLSRDSLSVALQRDILVSMERNSFWELVDEPSPGQSIVGFSDIPFLMRSGRQVGDEPRLYYIIPSVICRMGLPIDTELRLIRLYGAVLFGLSGAIVVWGLKASRRPCLGCVEDHLFAPIKEGESLTRIGIMASVGLVLLPMPSFIAGSANNDSMAIVTSMAVFALTTRIYLEGVTKRRLTGLLLFLVLAGLSKKTTLFLFPWVASFALVEITQALKKRSVQRPVPLTMIVERKHALVPLVAVILVAVVGVYPGSPLPEGWYSNVPPFASGVSRVRQTDGGRSNGAYLISDRSTTAFVRVFQWLKGPNAQSLAGQILEGGVYVRSPSGDPQLGCLVVRDTTAVSRYQFIARASGQRVMISHTVSQDADRIQFAIAPGSCGQQSHVGSLLVDDATLYDSSGDNLLINGNFDDKMSWFGWLVSNLRKIPLIGIMVDKVEHSIDVVKHDTGYALSVLQYRLHEMKPSISDLDFAERDRTFLFFRSLALLFPSFWGNYGWLQRPLPISMYVILAAICGWAMLKLGKVLKLLRPEYHRIFWYWILAAILIVIQSILPMLGHDWQPQGRYLFPALFPILSLLIISLYHQEQETLNPSQVWRGFVFLLILDLVSLSIASHGFV